jgi:preprotein translocase subunit SecG
VLKVLYWLAVLVVSLAVLVALVLLLESRDSSSIGHGFEPHSGRSFAHQAREHDDALARAVERMARAQD